MEREKLRQQQMEERERREKEQIQQSSTSQEEKEKLLREHKENMDRIRDAMNQEQSRSRQALQAKLDARKKRKMDTAKAKVDKEIILERDCEEMERLRNEDEDEDFLQAGTHSSVAGGIMSGPGDKSSSGPGQFTPTGNPEQDWVNMLMASPLFKQINDLADMLDKTEGGFAGGDKVLGKKDYMLPKKINLVKDWEVQDNLYVYKDIANTTCRKHSFQTFLRQQKYIHSSWVSKQITK